MEKGKRYAFGLTTVDWVEDSSGPWLYDPDKDYERLSEMHQTEVRENRELWEEIQKLKGAE